MQNDLLLLKFIANNINSIVRDVKEFARSLYRSKREFSFYFCTPLVKEFNIEQLGEFSFRATLFLTATRKSYAGYGTTPKNALIDLIETEHFIA